MALDFSTDHGKKALEQLESEIVIWFTTVTPAGVPQPNPVWFGWDAEKESVFTFVQPHSARIRNLRENPNVSLHFASDPTASSVTVFTGEVEFLEGPVSFTDIPGYSAKYDEQWEHVDMTVEQAAQEFSVPLRIQLKSLRGF